MFCTPTGFPGCATAHPAHPFPQPLAAWPWSTTRCLLQSSSPVSLCFIQGRREVEHDISCAVLLWDGPITSTTCGARVWSLESTLLTHRPHWLRVNPIPGGLWKVQFMAGTFSPPRPFRTRKLSNVTTSGKRHKIDRDEISFLRRSFSDLINIEVTRGHRRSNFEEIAFFRKQSPLSQKYDSYDELKKKNVWEPSSCPVNVFRSDLT